MNNQHHLIIPLFSLFLGMASNAKSNPLKISNISPNPVTANQIVQISGDHLSAHKTLEVIADYGQNKLYKLNIIKYKNNKIYVQVPDIGQNLNIQIFIKDSKHKSNKEMLTISPIITDNPIGIKHHDILLGGQGIDTYKIKNKKASCSQNGELFHHANINFIRKQFSSAKIFSIPRTNCSLCNDIKIKWHNEPTGILTYQLHIFKRQINAICESNTLQIH